MDYLQRHADLRADPTRLLPGARRVISARMDYLPAATAPGWPRRELRRLDSRQAAVVSIYARGRDYHKVLRQRLQTLASRIEAEVGRCGYRVATDTAPVLEVEFARQAGIGWRGKHTLLLSEDAGSMFFLGEILTDLPLPVDALAVERCGSCARCIEICPTRAITAPYQLDARRCISYLTIEHPGIDPGRAEAADRQSCLRLRRLPARLSMEQVRAAFQPARFRPEARSRQRHASRAVCMDDGRFREEDGWVGDPADRPRAMVAQHRGRARQRRGDAAGDRGAASAAQRREFARARARRMGARTARDRRGLQRRRQRGARLIAIGSVTMASSVCTVIAYATGVACPPMRDARM